MSTEQKKKFFVYGTLKEGGHFAKRFDEKRTSVKTAVLKNHDLFNLGSFPGIIPGKSKVFGEVHEYSEQEHVLRNFDMIENYDPENEKFSLYNRRTVTVTTEDNKEVEAEAYIYNDTTGVADNNTLIKNGYWPI